jgi:hypothetical protein
MQLDVAGGTTRDRRIFFHVIIVLMAFLILFSRRPDALLNAQFWAEDGKYWYPDAYNLGLHSLVMPAAGYLHVMPRLVALFTLLFPFAIAPLVMNLCGIVFQILPVNLFLSSRFSSIPLETRVFSSLLYLAMPNSFEIHANTTNIQWHLALIGCMVLLSQPQNPRTLRSNIFDFVVLILTSLDSPLGILLIPIAAAVWWMRKDEWPKWPILALIPGSAVQILMMLLSGSRQPAPNGANIIRLTSILGGQVFLSSILGLKTFISFFHINHLRHLFVIEAIAMVLGLAIVFYGFRFAPRELKLFLLFAVLVLVSALRSPHVDMHGTFTQWDLMLIPGIGNRYYFFPTLAFLGTLLWMLNSSSSKSRTPRYVAAAVLLLLPIGIFRDYQYWSFKDMRFQEFAAAFERAAPGTHFEAPINPGFDWTIEITKR